MLDCSVLKAPADEFDLKSALQQWFTECDRSESACIEIFYNKMHILGMKICVILSQSRDISLEAFDIQTSVYSFMPHVRINNKKFVEFLWADIVDMVTALQLNFNEYIENQNGEMELSLFLTYLMASIGKWLSVKIKRKNATTDTPKYCVLSDEGYIITDPLAVTQVLDALHTIGSTMYLLAEAEPPTLSPDSIMQELTEHHRECSLDKFYEISMAVDLPPGSITQYKHRHRENFHSLTQVVYYNWPSYARKRQESMSVILESLKHTHMLPLLHEMFPDVPVLYEHTGALLRSEHDKHTFSWVVLAGTIALVTRDYRFIMGDNIASVAAVILEDSTT